MKFTFNRGNWEDGNLLPEWEYPEEFGDYLKKAGFKSNETSFGLQAGSQIEIYESATDNGSFYASVCLSGDTMYEVFLPDFPSVMMFVKDYAPAFSTESVNFLQQETCLILKKMFQAQHGHSVDSICAVCDPVGWEENLEQAKRRAAKKHE